MRITGGEFCGRTLKVPKTDAVRPTQDRVREALFGILQAEVPGAAFLDLFAGTGAVGLEALSRGAASATFVESNRRHLAALRENVASCRLRASAAEVVTADAYRWIASYSGPGFSIGFADPPYALGEARGYASVLATLAARGVIRPGGLFAAEMTAVQAAEETPGWELLRDRRYGRTRLCLWRRARADGGEVQTITYRVRDAVYVNLTNRCPCACTFCLRNLSSGVYGSGSLWLKREPTVDEVVASVEAWDWTRCRELVFCGYGEPTERLDALLAVAAHMKASHPGVRVRVNTNGLADLIAGAPTAARFAGLVDCLSISLNTDDPETYLRLCRPTFGAAAYPALLVFAEAAARVVPDVVMTVVGSPVTTSEEQERCRAICRRLGARLRVRAYEARHARDEAK